jgi:hypothetical protein
MTQVYRPTPTVRFMHTGELALPATGVWHGTLWSTVVFLPTALRRGTRRNAIQLKTCRRTLQTFFGTVEKTERKDGLMAARLSSPRMHAGALRRELVGGCVARTTRGTLAARNLTFLFYLDSRPNLASDTRR